MCVSVCVFLSLLANSWGHGRHGPSPCLCSFHSLSNSFSILGLSSRPSFSLSFSFLSLSLASLSISISIPLSLSLSLCRSNTHTRLHTHTHTHTHTHAHAHTRTYTPQLISMHFPFLRAPRSLTFVALRLFVEEGRSSVGREDVSAHRLQVQVLTA